MKNYATEFVIPTSFVMNARVYDQNPEYVYQVEKFVIPQNEDSSLISKIEPSLPNFYKDFGAQAMILRLNKKTNASMDYVNHVVIPKGLNPITCFSLDGSMFAYLVIDRASKSNEQSRN